METKILVAFATKHGSTAEIAEAVGAELREAGLHADVLAAAEVRSLNVYDAVVVGSAVYMGKWQKDGVDFLKRFERELRATPTWLFSSGPTGGSPEADAALARAASGPTAIPAVGEIAKRAQRIGAREHATFPGRIGDEMTGFFERWIPRGDWRDFDRVRAWARDIASESTLREKPIPATSPMS